MKKISFYLAICLFFIGFTNTGYSQKLLDKLDSEVCGSIGAIAGGALGAAKCAKGGPVGITFCAGIGSEIGREVGRTLCEKPNRPSREKPSRNFDADKAYRDVKARQDRDFHERGGAWDDKH